MKRILGLYSAPAAHWVGDGFPVRTLFSYDAQGAILSPFLLLDYAGPAVFGPTDLQRGVGAHPHRGFETVTLVIEGELAHRDSTGAGGTIGPGDVQWMTAAAGIVHEEFHSPAFAAKGGAFEVVQLWVNLPAASKMSPPGYQTITASQIPVAELADDAGVVRVIAGRFGPYVGPARTHTPMGVWDVSLHPGRDVTFTVPEGHAAIVVVLRGAIEVNGACAARDAQAVQLSRDGTRMTLTTQAPTRLIVLSGEPINEPIAGRGPFVMNTFDEVMEAFKDYREGRFATLKATGH